MINKKILEDLRNKVFTGVVEKVDDRFKRGKIKVRVARIYDTLPIDDIPWAVPYDNLTDGKSFRTPEIGKVVKVIFPDSDWYQPEYFNAFHYNINLQEKLESLTDADYPKFASSYFDDEHQYYKHPREGLVFDYVKSVFNIKPNGDMMVALRDTSSMLYLGSTDGDQPALMTIHWLQWFDKLVNNLMGSSGGPYIGNLGAPVIANPAFLQLLNEYYAIRNTFQSTNVWIVDNGEIQPNKRNFDNIQRKDNQSTNTTTLPQNKQLGYQSLDKGPSKAPKQPGTPNDIQTSTLKEPADTLPSPISPDFENGKLPLSNLTKSKYLANGNSNLNKKDGGFDTEAFLIDEASQAFDQWISLYNNEKDPAWSDITFTDGYRTFERQQGMYKNNPTLAPVPGTSDNGWATVVDMYWGANPNVPANIDTDSSQPNNTSVNNDIYYWLKAKGAIYGFFNESERTPGRTDWWKWRYDTQKRKIATNNQAQILDILKQISAQTDPVEKKKLVKQLNDLVN